MDKFARWYGWFLLVACALPALMRLAMPGAVAEVTFERYSDPSRCTRYRRLAYGSGLAALLMVPAYFVWHRHMWLLVTAGLGLLSGGEMLANTSGASSADLKKQNVIFGILYVIGAIATYWLLLR